VKSTQNVSYVPNPAPIEVIYEDSDIAVVVKPNNLLTVPGRGPDKSDCAEARLKQKGYKFVRAAHRLDQDTSGLVIFGLTPEGHRAANMMFESKKVTKYYEAIVTGSPTTDKDEWLIDLPLALDWPNRPKHIVDFKQGKPSQTLVKIIERYSGKTRLLLKPITGRSHQLRVHLSYEGTPIYGDPLYGTTIDSNRMCLHACRLIFDHPLCGDRINLRSPALF